MSGEPKYRWGSPQEWLQEKLSETNDPIKLHEYATSLLSLLDADEVQDLFQSEMDADGYFTELDQGPDDPDEEEATGEWPEGSGGGS